MSRKKEIINDNPPFVPPPSGPSSDEAAALARLKSLLESLLDPDKGCPWDKKQTTTSLNQNILEETYELMEALALENPKDVLEESGDLAFLLVFLSFLTKKRWAFGLTEMLDGIVDKMVTRHPHVFGDQKVSSVDEVWKQWHKIKRAQKPKTGLLDSVPKALPALTRCHRLASKAGRAGFDWDGPKEVRLSVEEELLELDQELSSGNYENPRKKARLRHEIGDLLATVVNLSRHLGISAEEALTDYNRRFIKRFAYIEKKLAESGRKPEEATLKEMDALWQDAKKKA